MTAAIDNTTTTTISAQSNSTIQWQKQRSSVQRYAAGSQPPPGPRLAGLFREMRLHSRRQLFANAVMAASRVAA
jgi:hypothetical protein